MLQGPAASLGQSFLVLKVLKQKPHSQFAENAITCWLQLLTHAHINRQPRKCWQSLRNIQEKKAIHIKANNNCIPHVSLQRTDLGVDCSSLRACISACIPPQESSNPGVSYHSLLNVHKNICTLLYLAVVTLETHQGFYTCTCLSSNTRNRP